jgi:hypothetical protein
VTPAPGCAGTARNPSDPPHSRNAACRSAPPASGSGVRPAPANWRRRRESGPRRTARHRQSPPRASSSMCRSHIGFAILSHGPPSVQRLGSVRPSNPRFCTARKGGPPTSARGHNL